MITAPASIPLVEESHMKIFLSGGISGCRNWQSEMIEKFRKDEVVLYNPRRKFFDVRKPRISEQQIRWEYSKLRKSDAILYWFSKDSLNPIALYELGMWGNSRTTLIFVGIEPGYGRERDVVIQTRLARPQTPIADSLEKLYSNVKKYCL